MEDIVESEVRITMTRHPALQFRESFDSNLYHVSQPMTTDPAGSVKLKLLPDCNAATLFNLFQPNC